MPCRSSTRRSLAGSIASSTGREYRSYHAVSACINLDYSRITLLGAMTRLYRADPGVRVINDMEHYLRRAQQVIDSCCQRHRPRARDFTPNDQGDTESELVARLLCSAEQLGRDLAELEAWLENQPTRTKRTISGKRGAERFPLDRTRQDHSV